MAVASASSGPVVHSKIFLAQYILTRQEEKTQDIWGGKKPKQKSTTTLIFRFHCITIFAT
jgi:hypothetical protein